MVVEAPVGSHSLLREPYVRLLHHTAPSRAEVLGPCHETTMLCLSFRLYSLIGFLGDGEECSLRSGRCLPARTNRSLTSWIV